MYKIYMYLLPTYTLSSIALQTLFLSIIFIRYLDTDLLKVDIEPNYIRVTVKDKIFQLCLHQEIIVVKSKAQRSQITGHLIVTMPILKYDISEENFPKICVDSFNDFKIKSPSNIQGR